MFFKFNLSQKFFKTQDRNMSKPNEDFALLCEEKFKSIDRSLHLLLERVKTFDERLMKVENAQREMGKIIKDIKDNNGSNNQEKGQVREPIEGRDSGYNSCKNSGGFSF